MKQKNDIDYEKSTLIKITEFIEQEVYKLAVIKLFPKDFSKIYSLQRLTVKRVFPFKLAQWEIRESLVNMIVDNIVLGVDFESYKKNIKSYLDGSDGYWDKKAFQEAINIFHDFSSFQCAIPHQYSPLVLGETFDYKRVLQYIHELEFRPLRINSLSNELESYVTFTLAPFYAIKPYIFDQPNYSIETITEILEVPDIAFSKRIQRVREGIEEPIKLSPNFPYEAQVLLSILHLPDDEVSYTSKINFHVDLNNPIKIKELDCIMWHLRTAIISAQMNNKHSKTLIAETEEDLLQICNIPDLPQNQSTADISEICSWRTNIDIKSLKQAKDCLCGLILAKEYWVNSEDENNFFWHKNPNNKSLLDYRGQLSDFFVKEYGTKNMDNIGDQQGFSAASIERGYKKILKLMRIYEEKLGSLF